MMGDEPTVTRSKAPLYKMGGPALVPPPPEPTPEELAVIEGLKAIYAEHGIDRVLEMLEDAGVAEGVHAFMTLPPIEAVNPDLRLPPDPDYWNCHELHVMEVPTECRKRFMAYIRRRFGFSPQAAMKVAKTPGFVLVRGKARFEIEELLPDMESLGVKAELVVGDEDPE